MWDLIFTPTALIFNTNCSGTQFGNSRSLGDYKTKQRMDEHCKHKTNTYSIHFHSHAVVIFKSFTLYLFTFYVVKGGFDTFLLLSLPQLIITNLCLILLSDRLIFISSLSWPWWPHALKPSLPSWLFFIRSGWFLLF